MKSCLTLLMLGWSLALTAQSNSSTSPLSISSYLETYYTYDFANPSDHNRPGFLYSFNRHNEVNLNLGFVKAAYSEENVRANLALMAGTYANANLAAEPGVLRNVLESNAGVKLSKTKALWLDAGIFASHIGFESAIGKDCWNLTRGLTAETTPYYETGVKLGYTTEDEKWFVSALLLNGWQRIQRVPGNNTLAFGHQITYKPNEKLTLNSSSFIGSDKPDTSRQMRYFHNLYGIFQLSPKIAMTAGFDIGFEQTAKGSKDYYSWYTPIIMTRFQVSEKINLAARVEYYQDEHGVIIPTGTRNGFKTWGYSANLDYAIRTNFLWRLEARGFHSEDAIFQLDGKPATDNFMLATAFAISF